MPKRVFLRMHIGTFVSFGIALQSRPLGFSYDRLPGMPESESIPRLGRLLVGLKLSGG